MFETFGKGMQTATSAESTSINRNRNHHHHHHWTVGKCWRRSLTAPLVIMATAVATILLNGGPTCGRADDSAAAPALDMGALASLASNLGSNPQIMNLVSGFLNQAAQKPGPGPSLQGAPDIPGNTPLPPTDLDSNSIVQDPAPIGLKRGLRQQPPPSPPAPAAPTPAIAASTTTTTGGLESNKSTNPLSGLASLLPGLNLGNLGGLGGILGLGKSLGTATASSASSDQSSMQLAPTATTTMQNAASQQPNQQQQGTGVTPPQSSGGGNGANTAQSVINQVLTAYATGQIPNELIQLSLSGRIPPQIIELALSGQVPPQIIQMIITGQVPMSTINAFLATMQQADQNRQQTVPSLTTSSQANAGPGKAGSHSSSGGGGVFATTRSLFEALFNLSRSNNGDGSRPSITVPTLIGPIPIKVPSFSMPNVRTFGQLVGGTITNMASMIPF